MLWFSIFLFFLKMDPCLLEKNSVSNYSSALIFQQNWGERIIYQFQSIKYWNIGMTPMFLKFLVFQKHWQVNNRQVPIVAQYISCIEEEADALPCHFHISDCLWICGVFLDKEQEKRTKAFAMRCYRRLLYISLPMRRFAERSKQPEPNMMKSWPWSRNGN